MNEKQGLHLVNEILEYGSYSYPEIIGKISNDKLIIYPDLSPSK